MLRMIFEKENKFYPYYREIYDRITKDKLIYNKKILNVCCLYLLKNVIENDKAKEYDIDINDILKDFPDVW